MKERIAQWIAWKLPKSIAYWCAIRVGAHATGPAYPTTVVPEVTYMEVIKRWGEQGSFSGQVIVGED